MKALSILAGGLAVFSATSAIAQPPRTLLDAEKAIMAASADFDSTQERKDGAGMEHFLASDFRFVRASGELTDRKSFIAGFVDPGVAFKPFRSTNRIFVPLGLTGGIVGGEGVIEGMDRGKPFREHFRYADTYQWRDGRWQVVYVQVTPLRDS